MTLEEATALADRLRTAPHILDVELRPTYPVALRKRADITEWDLVIEHDEMGWRLLLSEQAALAFLAPAPEIKRRKRRNWTHVTEAESSPQS